jgi:hypothetical protein
MTRGWGQFRPSFRPQVGPNQSVIPSKKPELPLLILPAYQKAERVKKAVEQSELFG